jgi:hypothetical protein
MADPAHQLALLADLPAREVPQWLLTMGATSDGTCKRSKPISAESAAIGRRRRLGPVAWPGCIALTVLLAGCVRVAQVPDSRPAPVFELQVIHSRPCPTAADPQLACFAVELRNVGDKAGDGTCVVHHHVRDGEALVGEGPSFQARLRPGEVLRAQGQAHLTAPIASLRFNASYCNPGYRL